jgi:hypothetical protein
VSATTFLSNELLWQHIPARIKAARHVDAAIAYLGQGGAKLLPLRKGDRLVVDMSLASVTAGATDPREVQKLIRRGVQAFTRRNLHAKLLVADRSVICGSANVSKRSQQVLDEAAILTGDPSAVRRARQFIDRLCTEPVRPEYLKRCKRAYKPPRVAAGANRAPGQKRVTHAKLWIVNLREASIPESEVKRYEEGEAKAAKLAKDKVRCKTDSFHWPYKPRMASELEMGDWVVQVMRYKDKTIFVYPPAQFLLTDHYTREFSSRKQRWVFHLEARRRGQRMKWTRFRRAVNSSGATGILRTPRTTPVRDVQAADHILALWTPRGRISRR